MRRLFRRGERFSSEEGRAVVKGSRSISLKSTPRASAIRSIKAVTPSEAVRPGSALCQRLARSCCGSPFEHRTGDDTGLLRAHHERLHAVGNLTGRAQGGGRDGAV